MEDLRTTLEAARDAYRRRDWPAVRAGFEHARAGSELAADDLFQLSDAEWWLGHVDEAIGFAEAAYRL
ncbi:MAG: hypothetical protein ACRDGV_03105 [Candidatus Limnocylindria bacterium]